MIIWSLLAAAMLALCLERYGVNLVRYHTPVPDCDQVLTIAECQHYSPWARDYLYSSTYPPPTAKGIIVYPGVWLHRTVNETMFTITSYFYEPWHTVTYLPYPPLRIAYYAAWVVVAASLVAMLRYWRRLWDQPALRALLLISGFYTLILFLQNFRMYLHTGEAVAIHGRYLIPVYPILMLAAVVALAAFFRDFPRARLLRYRGIMAALTLLLILQGGGLSVWIIRSDPSWYWQHNAPAAQANHIAKNILTKVVYTK